MGRAGKRQVVGVAAEPAHEAQILEARQRPADIGAVCFLRRAVVHGVDRAEFRGHPVAQGSMQSISAGEHVVTAFAVETATAPMIAPGAACRSCRRAAPIRPHDRATSIASGCAASSKALPGRRARNARRADRPRRRRGRARRQSEGGVVPRGRPGAAGARRQRHRQPFAHRAAPSASSRTSCWRRCSAACAASRTIVEVSRAEAPVQEVVLTDGRRPHCAAGASPARRRRRTLHLLLDRLRASTRKTGWTNVGMRRLMLRGRREAGVDLVSPSDLRAIYEASAAPAQPLPVSFVVGCAPDRSRRGDHAAAGRRARARRGRCATRRCRWSNA